MKTTQIETDGVPTVSGITSQITHLASEMACYIAGAERRMHLLNKELEEAEDIQEREIDIHERTEKKNKEKWSAPQCLPDPVKPIGTPKPKEMKQRKGLINKDLLLEW